MKQNALKMIAASAIFICAGTVFAHEGHGLQGSHWHATDSWGFVTVAAIAALAIWWSRGGKK